MFISNMLYISQQLTNCITQLLLKTKSHKVILLGFTISSSISLLLPTHGKCSPILVCTWLFLVLGENWEVITGENEEDGLTYYLNVCHDVLQTDSTKSCPPGAAACAKGNFMAFRNECAVSTDVSKFSKLQYWWNATVDKIGSGANAPVDKIRNLCAASI